MGLNLQLEVFMWNKNRCMIYSTSVHNRTPNVVNPKAKLGDRWPSAMAFARFHTKTGPQTAGIIHHFVRVIRCIDKQASQLSLDMSQISFSIIQILISFSIHVIHQNFKLQSKVWGHAPYVVITIFNVQLSFCGSSQYNSGMLEKVELPTSHSYINYESTILRNVIVTLRN